MTTKLGAVLWATLILLLSASSSQIKAESHFAPAKSDTTDDACKYAPCPRVEKNVKIDTVDVGSGSVAVLSGTHFGKRQRVRVYVINLNPFAYDYKISSTTTNVLVAEPFGDWSTLGASSTDVKTAAPVSKATDSLAKVKANSAQLWSIIVRDSLAHSPNGAKHTTACTVQGVDITVNGNDLAAKGTMLESKRTTVLRQHSELLTKLSAEDDILHKESNTSEVVYKTASEYADNATADANILAPLADQVDAFKGLQRDASTLKQSLSNVTVEQQNNCLGAGASRIGETIALATGSAGDSVLRVYQSLSLLRDTLEKRAVAITSTLSSPSNFYSVITPDESDTTRIVTIDVARKAVGSKDDSKSIGTVILHFGDRPRFAFGVGAGSAWIRQQTFVRDQGRLKGDTAGAPLHTLVGLSEDSPSRIIPLVMLHGRLHEWTGPDLTLDASLGATVNKDNQNTDLEYLPGLSLGMLDERLFVTLGLYAGWRTELAGNLKVNDEVPESTAELPLKKRRTYGFGLGVTFRLK